MTLRVLLKAPLSVYTGYGNDGIGLARALMRSGADVYVQPTHVDAPLPDDVLSLLGKRLEAPFDLMIHHVDPMQLGLLPQERAASTITLAWSMWEYTNFANLKGRSKIRQALRNYDIVLGYDTVTADCFKPVVNSAKTAVAVLQGGFLPENWPKVERDWFSPRFGFAQPLTTKVMTPSGWKYMKDVSPGDTICSPSGKTQKVEKVYPRGILKSFEVTLKDGSVTKCSEDHLWQVKEYGTNSWKVMSTKDLLSKGLKVRSSYRWETPSVAPVFMADSNFEVAPYLLGALLGDGTLSSNSEGVSLVSADQELINECKSDLPAGVSITEWVSDGYLRIRFKGIMPYLRTLNLMGTTSHTKYVPDQYLVTSVSNRLALLQGLMDTDGTVSTKGVPSFTSYNRVLADDVAYLVRSLGGSASIKCYAIRDSDCYVVHISGLPFNPFRLQRKADKVIIRKRASRKAIVSIEEVGQEEMQCISVSSSDRTYITDDFVVTHNCMTGMLSERKDPFVTIMAFKELKEEYPEEFEPAELHLKTMSPGLHSAMEQWVPKLRVHYASWPEDVLKQFYATQHVLCAPSRGEGKNMPALEFQSMGGAVIATNWGGHTGWLSDEYAYPLNYKLMPLDGNNKVSNARADKDHMKALMLHTFRNRSEVKHKANLASAIIPQMMSWDAKVAQLYKKVAELVPGKGQEIYQKSLIPGGQNEQA